MKGAKPYKIDKFIGTWVLTMKGKTTWCRAEIEEPSEILKEVLPEGREFHYYNDYITGVSDKDLHSLKAVDNSLMCQCPYYFEHVMYDFSRKKNH